MRIRNTFKDYSFLIGIGVISLAVLLSGCTQTSKGYDPKTNVEPTDGFVFSDSVESTGLPTFESTPKEVNGWEKTNDVNEENLYAVVEYKKDGCILNISSQNLSSGDVEKGDYFLSKSQLYNMATGEQGTVENESMIQVKTIAGTVDFVSGQYDPQIMFDFENADAENQGGTIPVKEPYTTFIAVRSIGGSPATVPTEKPEGPSEADRDSSPVLPPDDSEYGEGEILSFATVPTIIIKYACISEDFNLSDATNMIAQLVIDTNAKK